ncbi:MAG: thymidine phosphorylase [Lachnospiraceae bacterium]|nr:thymidine phosphorylase [Lachnospiraceae bacterium]
MTANDIIDKKKKGQELTKEEIEYIINGYVQKKIPDYQISAWLMAVYFRGMTDSELLALTNCMSQSRDQVDLSKISGIKVDKHSTGGVGDKVTLVVAPVVAACGGKVAKMSGRGLGFTGGTVDKLEAIPGLQTEITEDKFFEIVNKIGLAVMGQSANIAPADKMLYALRDVTATVDSIPLIASSIMSKKLAAGSDKIVLDVTVGSGAFMKNESEAINLAEKMVAIGEGAGRETVAILTNMDIPLGCAVGNNIEVVEAIEALQGKGPKDLWEVCENIASLMLSLAGIGTKEECLKMVNQSIQDKSAWKKLQEMVEEQGGDASYITSPEKFTAATYQEDIVAQEDGYIDHMNTEECGKAAVLLGAGREVKEDDIDMTAGIHFFKKTGDKVKKGELLARAYSSSNEKLTVGVKKLREIYHITSNPLPEEKAILCYVTKEGVKR